jgi:hypothetical protein
MSLYITFLDQAHLAGVKGEVTGINETSSLNIPCAEPFYLTHAAALQLTGANTSASQELGENQGKNYPERLCL